MSDIDDNRETLLGRTKYKSTKDRQGSPGEYTLSSSSQTLYSKYQCYTPTQDFIIVFFNILYFCLFSIIF